MSRTTNSIKNATASIGGQLLNNLLRLVCRTVFIYTLGKEYLGISSLYSNILTVLNLSELGMASAITYSLYAPLAQKDTETVKSLMLFFKRAYQVVGLVILAVGLCLMPFLPKLMNGVTDKVNIYHYYLLYLMQTVVSYLFFAYKGTLLNADQKKYVSDIVMYVVMVVTNIVQIVILFVLKSFLLYTVVSVLSSAVQNIVTALVVDRRYPYLKEPAKKLSKERRKSLWGQVYAMSLYKVASTVSTATDNLIISSYISVLMVGLYDNYYMIIQVIQKLFQGFFRGFTASLGNFYATESKERNLFLFRSLNLLNSVLVVFCSVAFLTLFQPFVSLWIGEEYLLSYPVVITVVMNFATNYMQTALQTYKDASGLFVRGKYRAVATAVLNLLISIILVQWIGLPGVFLGSIISRLVTTWWYDAWLLHRVGFECSPARYYWGSILDIGMIFLLTAVILGISSLVEMSLPVAVILRGVLSVVLTVAVYALLYGRSAEWRYLWEKATAQVKKKWKRK